MKKNKKLLIVVCSLLLVGGVSFAYFIASTLFSGEGSNVGGTTAIINDAELRVEGTLEFQDLDIYPGHQNVSSVKVTATGDNTLIPYNLVWNGTNTLNTSLNYTVYKTSSEVEVSATCEKEKGVVSGALMYYEECSISNLDSLGTPISTGVINTNDTKVILSEDEFITASPTGEESFYYIILEYPNLDESQNSDIGGSFSGEVTVEESDAEPDINIIAAYIEQEDGTYQEVSDIPQTGYIINQEKSVCSNGAIPSWINNGLFVENLTKSGTSCYLYFEIYEPTAADTIEGLYPDNQTMLAYDEHNNLRYIGANPNNYVSFNDELWRIIGVFSEDTHGLSGQKLIKLIRSESLGNIAWDTKNTYGVNDWSTAGLQTALNGEYLNGTGSYTSTGIKSDAARNMIETVTWKLGGTANYSSASNGLASHFYGYERGTTVYSGRPTTWSGKVALMYPSDYGYATSGGSTTNREACLVKELYNWNSSSFSDCKNNDWLYDSSAVPWTLTSDSSTSNYVFFVNSDGSLNNAAAAFYGNGVHPSIYLKSNIGISGGTGVSSDPYKLSIQ